MTELTPSNAMRLVSEVLSAWGASKPVASCVAEHLVEAELAGHASHGIRQMIRYLKDIESGKLDPRAEPTILSQSRALTTVDANGGIGHPALALAVDSAAAAADEHGIGISAVIRCGHAGRMGAWVERGLRHDKVTLAFLGDHDEPFSMASAPQTAASLHTNPIAIGIPAEQAPLVVDMATSVVAMGKVALAQARGQLVAAGSLIDSAGQETNDPGALFAGGALLPAGGHKGFALAAAFDALSIAVTGADAPAMTPGSGALVICFPADAFRPGHEVRSSVEALRSRLHASSRGTPVLLPGEPEARSRLQHRITVDDDVLALLRSTVCPPSSSAFPPSSGLVDVP